MAMPIFNRSVAESKIKFQLFDLFQEQKTAVQDLSDVYDLIQHLVHIAK